MPAVPPTSTKADAATARRRSRPLRRGGRVRTASRVRAVSASSRRRSRRLVTKSGRGAGASIPRIAPTTSRSSASSGRRLTCAVRPLTAASNSSARFVALVREIIAVFRSSLVRSQRATTGPRKRLRCRGPSGGPPSGGRWSRSDERCSARSSQALRHELGEVADAAQLQLLDRAVAAAQHLGGLGDRESLEEPHDEALLLLGGQLPQGLE